MNEETHVIDLRSDTVTRPTPAMREAMMNAIVGDDQYGEDATVNHLEEMSARLLGKEAAVFVASGTMGNLSAILAHCQRGDEVILGDESHILWYESAGPATVGGVSPRTVRTASDGTLDLDEVEAAIRVDGPGYPPTGLITVENTHNRCGGAVLGLDYMRDLRSLADSRGLPIHLDGARIFNAAAALGVSPAEIAAQVDFVQFCFSKGLAAPVGSMVVGSAEFIVKVRRARKLLGGAMRQAGVIAAAAVVSLQTMIERLSEDHRRAQMLAEGITAIPGLAIDLASVQSNIVVFRPEAPIDQNELAGALRGEGILSSDFGRRGIRMVTHYEITDEDITRTLDVLAQVAAKVTERAHVRV
jgi:threonine aldolase